MEFQHESVLLDECIDGLQIKPNGVYMDSTLGGAGHAQEIYKRLDASGTLIGIDQDKMAIAAAKKRLESMMNIRTANETANAKLILANTNFSNLKKVCIENKIEKLDGILFDLGVSSFQLSEQAGRGFSFQFDSRLDMRMCIDQEVDAYDVVNTYSEKELTRIIREYGEEKWASRIAKFIVAARKKQPIETTFQLVDITKAAIPASARRDGPHPCTRLFQSIRIEVNGELRILEQAIRDGVDMLRVGGRICVISFHSLEDRISKHVFAELAKKCKCATEIPICVCDRQPIVRKEMRKPIIPDTEELKRNPRARSAKLRICTKLVT